MIFEDKEEESEEYSVGRITLKNTPFNKRWKKTPFGRIKLRCPICNNWFFLSEDITFDGIGNASDVFYHNCEAEANDIDDEEEDLFFAGESRNKQRGWVALVHLEGWE